MSFNTTTTTSESCHNGSAFWMTSIMMINIQHTNMETHTLRLVWWSPSRKEEEARVDPSVLPKKCFYSGLHTILECKDSKLWPVSGCITSSLVSTLKGRAGNKTEKQILPNLSMPELQQQLHHHHHHQHQKKNSTTSTTTNVQVLVPVSSLFFWSYHEGAFTLGVKSISSDAQ